MNMTDVTTKRPILLAAIQAAPPGGLLDSELATKVGIADRDALRAVLAVMAADGQIAAKELGDGDAVFWVDLAKSRQQDRLATSQKHSTPDPQSEVGWVDGEAPLIIRLAPTGAPTLASRVTDALLDAGMDGLEEDTVYDVLVEDVATDVPCDLTEQMPHGFLQPTLDALTADCVIRSVGCNHYALTAKKWAVLIDEATRRVSEENPKTDVATLTFLRLTAIERLLAGTDPQ